MAKAPFLVGVGHTARAGKDSFGTFLVDALRQQFKVNARRYGFADALKAYCRVAYGMREKNAPLLQDVGLRLRTEVDENVWLNVCLDTIAEDAPEVAVIADVRFENEAEAVAAAGGLLIKIERPDFVVTDRPADHPSETALSDYPWPLIVENSGSLHQLELSAWEIAAQIKETLNERA